jgi:hypothetical protein
MRSLIPSVLALAVALPAAADRLVIDDDGHRYVPDVAPQGLRIVIGDDDWSYVEPEVTRSIPAADGPRPCTQFERSMGVEEPQCGRIDVNELIRRHLD